MNERRMAYLHRYEEGHRMGMHGFVKAGRGDSGWKGTVQMQELPGEGSVKLAAVIKKSGQTVYVRAMEEIHNEANRLRHPFQWGDTPEGVLGVACMWGNNSWDIAMWEDCPWETMTLQVIEPVREPEPLSEPEPVQESEAISEPELISEPTATPEPLQEREPLPEPDPTGGPSEPRLRMEERYQELPSMYPFDDDELSWCVRMETQHLSWLPERYARLAINSFLLEGYYSYRHLLFAKKEHGNQKMSTYLLGIPGVYHKRDCFLAGMFGFTVFKPVKTKGVNNRFGQFGYWCMPIYEK